MNLLKCWTERKSERSSQEYRIPCIAKKKQVKAGAGNRIVDENETHNHMKKEETLLTLTSLPLQAKKKKDQDEKS